MITNAKKSTENFDDVIPFEPDYEAIKLRPNDMYFKHEANILKLVRGMAKWKNVDKGDLGQQAYLYFIQLCEKYDPYYMGHFFPFDRYVFKNLIIKLRAYIQRYYYEYKREKPSEFCEFHLQKVIVNDIHGADSDLYMEQMYGMLSNRQRMILKLTLDGFKQQEIGGQLNISQSRVSVIKKKAFDCLYDTLDDKHTAEEKNERHVQQLARQIYATKR